MFTRRPDTAGQKAGLHLALHHRQYYGANGFIPSHLGAGNGLWSAVGVSCPQRPGMASPVSARVGSLTAWRRQQVVNRILMMSGTVARRSRLRCFFQRHVTVTELHLAGAGTDSSLSG